MKNRKILAILLSVAMLCSSLPAYAAADVPPSGVVSEQTNSQSASINEGTETAQNNESSSQAEPDASGEEAVDNENNSQEKSNASGEEAVNNENNSQAESNASGEETVNSEATSQAENNNINEQNTEELQINNKSVAQNVYDLCNGDIDVYYEHGVYYTTQNNEQHANAQPPIISSNIETSNQVHLHDFVPDEMNVAPYVVIRDLNIANDSTALEIDGIITLQVENDCFLKTSSETAAAIDVDEDAEFTILGSGSLYVSSSGNGAAIGGAGLHTSTGQHTAPTCGNIKITGDVQLTAENTGNGAGIGGGYNYGATCVQRGGDVKNITIGGNADVTAISNGGSAAIGGGGTESASFKGYAGDCSSVIIKDDANVKATANNSQAAAIGSGANCGKHVIQSRAGDVEIISILDYATVYATGGFVAIGSASDYSSESDVDPLSKGGDPGELCVASTASLEAYSMTNLPINSKCKSVDNGVQNNNIIVGNFKNNSALNSQKVLQVVNTDSKQYTKNVNMPAGTESFAFTTPSTENYAMFTVETIPDSSNDYKVDQAIENMDNHNFLFTGHKLENGKSLSDYSVPANLIDASVNMDLSNGSITISKINDVICLEQNGQMQVMLPNKENISISQSSEQTENTITVEGNVDGSQPIILENLNISCEHPIVVEEGADVNLIFHNNNSLTATNCQKSTDYPAIEVPGGATVTLSGDGSLNATANGYAAAIGTKGYYRDGKDHSDGNKSSGTVQIEDSLNVKAHSAYGAGIGGGAINGSSCEQHAFDNGTVIIKGSAVVEALGSTEGGYSAGIGGGGCYTSTCAAVGGNGGDVQILENAHVTAVCKGSLGAGIGGGGGCGKTADGFGGDGESFKADNSAVVVATGAKYGPGIGGGGAQQKTCCGTHPGNSGSCSVLGNSNVTAQNGGKVSNFGIGGHTGGWANYNGSYTEPQVDSTATFNA